MKRKSPTASRQNSTGTHALLRETINRIIIEEGVIDDLKSGAAFIGRAVGAGYDALKGTAVGDILGIKNQTQSGLNLKDMEKILGTSGSTFADIADATRQFLDDLHDDEDQETLSFNWSQPETSEGIEFAGGVQMTDRAADFLERLRDNLDPGILIYVSSVGRNPAQQASAMFTKWVLGGDNEIESVYGKLISDEFLGIIDEMRSQGNTDSEIARMRDGAISRIKEMVEDLQASGKAFTGSHLVGNALDLRTIHLTPDQIDKLEDAAVAAGGRVLIEKNPPHMHVEV